MRKLHRRDKIEAVLVADLHLSDRAPRARAAEPDWYAVMRRQLHTLDLLRVEWDTPILCAGDIFHSWNVPPELINFCLAHLPEVYAVPGQHDLPHHRYDAVHRSAFGTMRAVRRVIDISDGPVEVGRLVVHPFRWGRRVRPLDKREARERWPGDRPHVALIHAYVWVKGCGYPGAPEEKKLSGYDLSGYHAAVFGDNHKGFSCRQGRTHIWNCGGFIPRNSDERDYAPRAGLLHASGAITPVPLDTSRDKWVDEKATAGGGGLEVGKILARFDGLSRKGIDFREAVERFLRSNKVERGVKDLLLKSLEGKK